MAAPKAASLDVGGSPAVDDNEIGGAAGADFDVVPGAQSACIVPSSAVQSMALSSGTLLVRATPEVEPPSGAVVAADVPGGLEVEEGGVASTGDIVGP